MRTLYNIVLFASLLFLIAKADCQNIPVNSITNRIEYEEIIEFPNKTKDVLFHTVREWILVNDMPIILFDSIGNNKIICERLFNLKWTEKGLLFSTIGTKEYGIRYNIIIDFKDGKIRCRVTNLNFLEYKSPSATGIHWGYGVTSTMIKEGEILKYDAENFYPLEKNEKKYYEMYSFFFDKIHDEIVATYSYIKNYINTINDNW